MLAYQQVHVPEAEALLTMERGEFDEGETERAQQHEDRQDRHEVRVDGQRLPHHAANRHETDEHERDGAAAVADQERVRIEMLPFASEVDGGARARRADLRPRRVRLGADQRGDVVYVERAAGSGAGRSPRSLGPGEEARPCAIVGRAVVERLALRVCDHDDADGVGEGQFVEECVGAEAESDVIARRPARQPTDDEQATRPHLRLDVLDRLAGDGALADQFQVRLLAVEIAHRKCRTLRAGRAERPNCLERVFDRPFEHQARVGELPLIALVQALVLREGPPRVRRAEDEHADEHVASR